MSATESFTLALTAVLRRELQGFQSIESCRQLSAGASQETYCITYRSERGITQLALRRSPPTQGSESNISLETEARLFRTAAAHQIPSPEVLYILKPDDQLGSGFLMNWLEGETLGHRINRRPELDDIRPRLARQCGEVLGRIHSINWAEAKLDKHLRTTNTLALIEQGWNDYKTLNVPVPMIDYTWRWLKENIPEQSRNTLVHADFRNGNLMVNPEGINAVLDWELAHIGDPIQDLGWLCVNSWRFGNRHKPVGGFGEINDLLDGYKRTSGIDVSTQALNFWQVYGSCWWASCTLAMAHSWRTGESPSLERPVIGRRSSEAQMDCVNLLMPGPFTLPVASSDLAKGTQLPMPAELLAGVAEFLKDTAAPNLDSHNSFLAKVAANSLGIATREFQYGPALAQAEQQRLAALLGQQGELDVLRWEIVMRLRDGWPLDTAGLAEHLRQTVAGQLAIDQPHYSALQVSESTQ
jgi:aminoglycoside phosphotransferase (APT) family kinase protein